jgi:hypothetical protein
MPETLSPLMTTCQSIMDMPVEQLLRRPQLGELDFAEVEKEVRLAVGFAIAVRALDETKIPNWYSQQLREVLQAIAKALNDLREFTVGGYPNPQETRRQRIGQVQGLLEPIKTGVQFISAMEAADTATGAKKLNLDALIAEVRTTRDHFRGSVDEATKEIVAMIAAQKTATAKTGVEVHAQQFETEAATLSKASYWWLATAAALACAAIVAAIGLALLAPPEATAGWIAQYSVTRIFVVGVLLGAAFWCGSVYRAMRHQITVNRHRMNALRTFKAFVEAAETEEIRQAILLETTRSIFATSPTGFLQATESNVDGPARMIDAVTKLGRG